MCKTILYWIYKDQVVFEENMAAKSNLCNNKFEKTIT